MPNGNRRLQSDNGFIEILGVDLIREDRSLGLTFQRLADRLGIQLGWHYLLDLVWAAHHVSNYTGQTLLDAGAGLGVMQWWLAENGAEVFSVDREDRRELPFRYRARYRVTGMRGQDLAAGPEVLRRRVLCREVGLGRKVMSVVRACVGIAASSLARKALGSIVLYHNDLGQLSDIRSESVDAVVAISSLEHNSPEALPSVVRELMRVLKPGGRLVATLGAAKEADWFHEPSQGWCYTDASLRKLFGLDPDAPSNYVRYDELMTQLRESDELRRSLAPFHFASGDNGMPWGRWDPQYQPVGVLKVKAGWST